MSFTVLLLEKIHEVAEAQLKEAGFTVRRVNAALKEDELIKELAGVNLLGIRSKTNVTKKVLESPQAKDLMAIGAFCIGTNQIALADAMRQGICVFNAPFSNTRSVAELVIAEIVMLSRQLGDRDIEMHQGVWKKLATGAHEVRGKTLGIVGYGHIGSQVGVLSEFFGMRVVYFDVATKLPLSNNSPCRTLDEVLKVSDFVTLHVPETPQTKGLIGRAQLQMMKKEACLINASRGTVVDLEALAELIKSGHLGGAAVDVYPDEPEGNESKGFTTPLQGVPNVILTPHIGGSTLEAQESIGREVATSLIKYVSLGASAGSVNFPQVELPPTEGTFRLMHVHQNVPGVLRDVNRLIGDTEANIHAQLLSTNPDIGYLVMDLDNGVTGQVTEQLRKLSTTIKARALS
ncbi:MAG: phosphoglycerate dehydrogenase [Myxococcales bacterium]|nr:phosphoglycerate dehydrogenase [Myxococcales bacterium]MDP3505312.1 phosphoglycerate dehydrogenase [Myxococcales bacterium]